MKWISLPFQWLGLCFPRKYQRLEQEVDKLMHFNTQSVFLQQDDPAYKIRKCMPHKISQQMKTPVECLNWALSENYDELSKKSIVSTVLFYNTAAQCALKINQPELAKQCLLKEKPHRIFSETLLTVIASCLAQDVPVAELIQLFYTAPLIECSKHMGKFVESCAKANKLGKLMTEIRAYEQNPDAKRVRNLFLPIIIHCIDNKQKLYLDTFSPEEILKATYKDLDTFKRYVDFFSNDDDCNDHKKYVDLCIERLKQGDYAFVRKYLDKCLYTEKS